MSGAGAGDAGSGWASVMGALTALTVVMKGLPLAYSKDMQEAKEPVFEAADTLALTVEVMTGMIADMSVNAKACGPPPTAPMPRPPIWPTGWCARPD